MSKLLPKGLDLTFEIKDHPHYTRIVICADLFGVEIFVNSTGSNEKLNEVSQ